MLGWPTLRLPSWSPTLLLRITPEASSYYFWGSVWSLAAGSAGAIGALGIIMAFDFGGRPVYVMPLVFGGAPVVNTLFSTLTGGLWDQIGPMFLAGLILVIAGAAMTLVFAPKGGPPASSPKADVSPKPKHPRPNRPPPSRTPKPVKLHRHPWRIPSRASRLAGFG